MLVSFIPAQSAPSSVYVKTPVGDTIPHNVLNALLPNVPIHELYRHLHHISSDFKLTSHDGTIDLNKFLGNPEKVIRGQTVVFVNQERSFKPPVGYFRRGKGYSVTTTNDGTVVSVHAPGKILQPVGLKTYPNLFVDVRAKSKGVSFGDDEFTVPDVQSASNGDNDPVTVENAEPSCLGASAPPQFVEIAVAADSALCLKYGNAAATETAVLSLITRGENIYKQSMCIRFTVTVLDINCNTLTDPYAGITEPLTGFKSVWVTLPASSIHRDVVLFTTGVNFLDNVAGQAYVGVTCYLAYSYMWVDLMHEVIFAHEIGHNMNASHTTEGLMKATVSLANDNYFNQESINQIVTFVDAETSRSICIEGATPSPDPSPSSSPSSIPSPSLSTIPSATSSPAAITPTASPSFLPPTSPLPPGPSTCDSLLLDKQSMQCVAPSASSITSVQISVGSLTGTLSLTTTLEQRYGFGLGVSAPSRMNIGAKKNKKRLTISVTNVQVLAAFNAVTQGEVESQTSNVLREGSIVTGFHYPGPLDVPSEITSCCGQEMKVSAVITINLTGSGISSEVKVYIVRDTTMQCVQYGSCTLEFTAMSDSIACPVCQN